MGVRQFRSDESGAPELVQAPGSIVNLLKKVLVDGYGSTDPHGSWEYIEDSVAEKAAFRSTDPNANGIWLYIDDTGTEDSRAAIVGMAENFTGFDGNDDPNGDTVWGLPPDYSNDQWVVNAYNTPDPVGWIIVCDERFFYLWNATAYDAQAVTDLGWIGYWYGGEQSSYWDPAENHTNLLAQYANACWSFGDLQDGSSNDGFSTILTVHGRSTNTVTSQSYLGAMGSPEDTGYKWLARGGDQLTKGVRAYGAAMPWGRGDWCQSNSCPPYPEPLSGGVILGGGAIITDDPDGPGAPYTPRGRFPGMLPIYHDVYNAPGAFAEDFPIWTEVTGSLLDGTPLTGGTALVAGVPTGSTSIFSPAPVLLDIAGPWRT